MNGKWFEWSACRLDSIWKLGGGGDIGRLIRTLNALSVGGFKTSYLW